MTSPHLVRVNERIVIDGEPISNRALAANWADIRPFVDMVDAELIANDEEPLTYLRGPHRARLRELRRRAGRRRRHRGRDGRRVGLHERRRRPGGGLHPHRARPHAAPRQRPSPRSRARRRASSSRSPPWSPPRRRPRRSPSSSAPPSSPSRASPSRGRRSVSRPRRSPSAGSSSRCAASPAPTATCSCRCSASTRATTPRSRSPRSSRSSATEASRSSATCSRRGSRPRPRPGRLQVIGIEPTVIVDAAHNPHGATALAAALTSYFTFDEFCVVLGVLADKDAAGIVEALAPVATRFHVTRSQSDRAIDRRRPRRGRARMGPGRFDGDVRVLRVRGAGCTPCWASASPRRAVVVTGSITLVGEAIALAAAEGWR